MNTKNYEQGKKIQQLLIRHNVESPMIESVIAKWQNADYHSQIQQKVAALLEAIGLDMSDASVERTPHRVTEFFLKELFYGLDYHNFPNVLCCENTYAYKMPLISNQIQLDSTCEHHFVSIQGVATVGYVPAGNIVGLSKLNRVVDFFAKRPQVQERLTRQIFLTLQELLGTLDVAVAINAKHNCIAIRGIQDTNTRNTTVELGGVFATDAVLKQQIYSTVMGL